AWVPAAPGPRVRRKPEEQRRGRGRRAGLEVEDLDGSVAAEVDAIGAAAELERSGGRRGLEEARYLGLALGDFRRTPRLPRNEPFGYFGKADRPYGMHVGE